LIVQEPFQGVDGIQLHVDWNELTLELLFEVNPRLNGKNAGVRFLAKEVLGPLRSSSILEEGKSPENLFLIIAELLRGQAQIQHTGIEEGLTRALFTGEVGGRKEFWPCPLFGQGGQGWKRRDSRRRRHGYQRRSDCWSGGKTSHELSELL